MARHALASAVDACPMASAACPRRVWELHFGSLIILRGRVLMPIMCFVCSRARFVPDGLLLARSWSVVVGLPRCSDEWRATPGRPRAIVTGILRGDRGVVEYRFRIEGYFWMCFDVVLVVVVALLAEFVAVHKWGATSAAECVPLLT